eukprot:TRINITY_DN8882_c0_g1_i1.p1 TRINITY_DN8882_c0_g1~~TRINITY_DN8882_c0_g1_i1.p1  ORF type:complete len:368 (+),score=69.05 TRINITY_DN8882_c0_g1_i1:28-1104(+)
MASVADTGGASKKMRCEDANAAEASSPSKEPRRPRVLVVGGTGYVAQFVLRGLLAEGSAEVHITYHSRAPMGPLAEVSAHQLDLTDLERTAAVVKEIKPDIIVNCAAAPGLGFCQKSPDIAALVNCKGPQTMVEALAEIAGDRECLFVHFSTDIVFDGDAAKIYDEAIVPEPLNIYGRVKADMDAFLQSSDAPPHAVVIRPTNVIGPKAPFGEAGGTKFLQWLDSRLQVNEPSKLFVDELRNYVWVEDLVDVTLKLIADFTKNGGKSLPGKLLHCGGPESLNRVEVAERLADAKGHALTYVAEGGKQESKIVPTPRAAVDLGYESPLVVKMCSRKLEAYMGRSMRNIGDAIRKEVARI